MLPGGSKGIRPSEAADAWWQARASLRRDADRQAGMGLALLGYDCGLREGEIAALRKSDLALDGGVAQVVVAATVLRDGTVQPHPQGKYRAVVATRRSDTVGALLGLAHHRAGMRCSAPGRANHLCLAGIHKSWKTAREAAELDEVRFHDLRHPSHRGGRLAGRGAAILE